MSYAINRVMNLAVCTFDRDLITVADVNEIAQEIDQLTTDDDIGYRLAAAIERNRDKVTVTANKAFGAGYNTAMGWND